MPSPVPAPPLLDAGAGRRPRRLRGQRRRHGRSCCAGTGKTVRPHVKTHRTPGAGPAPAGRPGGRRHLRHGRRGRGDGRRRASTTSSWRTRSSTRPRSTAWWPSRAGARVAVAVDDPEPVAAAGARRGGPGVTVGVLIDVDILLHRCGRGVRRGGRARWRAPIERLPGRRARAGSWATRAGSGSASRTATRGSPGAYATLAEVRAGAPRGRLPGRRRVGVRHVDARRGAGRPDHHRAPVRASTRSWSRSSW